MLGNVMINDAKYYIYQQQQWISSQSFILSQRDMHIIIIFQCQDFFSKLWSNLEENVFVPKKEKTRMEAQCCAADHDKARDEAMLYRKHLSFLSAAYQVRWAAAITILAAAHEELELRIYSSILPASGEQAMTLFFLYSAVSFL